MKKVIFCALILLGCFAGAARADDPYEAGLAIIDGEGFAGLDRAVEQFKVAVELPGRARDARLGIARARILQYELSEQPRSTWLDEARAELDVLIRARAMDADAHFLMSQLLLDEQKPDEAMTFLRRAALAAPDREDIAGAYFYRLLDLGQVEQARLYAQRRLQDAPGSAMVVLMAQGLLDAGQPQAAEELASLGLSENPKNPDLLVLSAQALKAAGEYEKAIARLNDLLRAAPDRSETFFELGLLYGTLNNYDQAIEWTRGFLDLDPGNVSALNNLAIYLEQRGDQAAAAAVWQQILEQPDVETAYRRRAEERLAAAKATVPAPSQKTDK